MFGQMNPMMGGPVVPAGGDAKTCLIMGDLTIVQNHNFGQPMQNPMQQMQLLQAQNQIMIQQQQMKMLAMGIEGMQNAIKNVSEQLEGPKQTLLGNDNETLKLANKTDVEDAEFTIVEEDLSFKVKDDKKKPIFDEVIDLSNVKHMKSFFRDDGSIDRQVVKEDTFLKVEEDQHTYAMFVSHNDNDPYGWENKFINEYDKNMQKMIKTSNITNPTTRYMVILESGFTLDLICIIKGGEDISKEEVDQVREYADGMKAKFRNIMIIKQPDILPENKRCILIKAQNEMDYVEFKSLFVKDGYIYIPTSHIRNFRKII